MINLFDFTYCGDYNRQIQQLQNIPGQPGAYRLISAKNGKSRTIALPSTVITI